MSVFAGLHPSQASGPNRDGSGYAVVAALTGVLVTLLGMLFVALMKRMDNEDAMLEKNFGEEWRAWAKKVPCRVVPGVCWLTTDSGSELRCVHCGGDSSESFETYTQTPSIQVLHITPEMLSLSN